jgi:hypothetical protein
MATVYKNAQLQGTAAVTTYGTLYSTGASTTAVISSILICNTAATQATYRIGIMGTAGTPAAAEYIVYGATVAASDTTSLTLGITLSNTQYIRVSSSANTVTFSAFISEIS